jgi:hypothetical protein
VNGWVLAASILAAPAADADVNALLKAALQKSGPAIDACVAGYVDEKPGARGTARVVATFAKDGTVSAAKVQTGLDEPRNLLVCLRRVARTWKLPPLAEEGSVAVTVNVYRGAKFDLGRRAEKREADAAPPEADEEAERPLGDFTFRPGGFWVGTWGGEEVPGEAPTTGPGTGRPDPDVARVEPSGDEAPGDE